MVDNVWFVVGSMFFLMTATLTTNVAANAVAPATVIVQVTEGRVNFKWAVLVLGIIAILIRPWALVGDLSMYQNMFLVRRTPSLSVEGPRVQMIFVFLINIPLTVSFFSSMMGAQVPDMPCGRWPDIGPVRCV